MIDHARQILAAIIPSRRDLLITATTQLVSDHFRANTERSIFQLLERYYNLTGAILTRQALSDLLARQDVDVAKRILYEELYDTLASTQVQDHEFRYAIDALKDQRAAQLTEEAIGTSNEILKSGLEINRLKHKGHVDARDYLYRQLASIDRLEGSTFAPEGDIRTEGQEVKEEYAARKAGRLPAGVFCGIDFLDNTTLGFQNGELDLVCAYTGEGKTTFTAQLAWYAVTQGKNVFFATSETIRQQIRRKIYARHSRQSQFNLPDGLNTRRIKSAELSPQEEKTFFAVVDDFTNNPAYGHFYLAQIPRGGTLGFLEARILRQQSSYPIDIVIIDYLALLKPDRHRSSKREELDDLLKDCKTLAASFADGRGVPIVSPWAMSQSSYKEALRTGEFTLANLADTSEAEKSSDVILSFLRLPDTPHELKVQFLKNRDGETPPAAVLEVDYGTCFMAPKKSLAPTHELLEDL